MGDTDQKPTDDKPGRYGKRPAWQWVVIYLVVAVVVYGLIYYFFIRKSGNADGGGLTY